MRAATAPGENPIAAIAPGRNPRRTYFLRAAAILGLTDLPVEPLCYTEEEFAELVRDENPFILRALVEGIRV